jgi:hypothetical protein
MNMHDVYPSCAQSVESRDVDYVYSVLMLHICYEMPSVTSCRVDTE